MPNAGGQFVYIQRAYGRLVSFIWTVLPVIQTGVIAAIAVTLQVTPLYFFLFLMILCLKLVVL
jgi:APA family basic amino acid/polyamine antiporter